MNVLANCRVQPGRACPDAKRIAPFPTASSGSTANNPWIPTQMIDGLLPPAELLCTQVAVAGFFTPPRALFIAWHPCGCRGQMSAINQTRVSPPLPMYAD